MNVSHAENLGTNIFSLLIRQSEDIVALKPCIIQGTSIVGFTVLRYRD
jgi:hypothetical protein